MRSFALGTFALAFGLAACNPDKDTFIGSATEGTGADTTGPGTTEAPDGTTSTSGVPEPTSTTAPPTTGEPTPTTSGEPGTSTTSTTGDTGEATIGETTGEDPVFPQGGPYGSCNNDMGNEVQCDPESMCLDDNNVMALDGAFCSFKCDNNPCPEPMDLPPSVQSLCAFDSNNDDKADLCALLCNMDNDECPGDMACDDVGIPVMMNMKFGICTWPKG